MSEGPRRDRLKLRLLAWIVPIGLSLTMPFGLLRSVVWSIPLLTIQGLVAIGAFLWLIQTTPDEAVRLKRSNSVLIILLGMAWLGAAFAAALGPLTMALVCLAALFVLFLLWRPSTTPWLSVTFAWHPALYLAPIAIAPDDTTRRTIIAVLIVAALLMAALTPILVLPGRRVRPIRRQWVRAWLAWTASSACTMAAVTVLFFPGA